MPTVSADVENVALTPDNVPPPIETPPSKKVAVPVGVPEPGATALIVAVKVTVWPNTDGFTDDVTDVELDALLTVWVMAAEVLALKLASPP